MTDRTENLESMEPTKARGKQAQQVAAIERELRCLELRKQGKSYAEIASAVGYKSKGSAYKAVERALTRCVQEPAEELRIMELERLNSLMDSLWEEATTPGAKNQTFAVDRVLNIMKRRADLLGLNAPKKQEVITKDAVTKEIERLERNLGPSAIADIRKKFR